MKKIIRTYCETLNSPQEVCNFVLSVQETFKSQIELGNYEEGITFEPLLTTQVIQIDDSQKLLYICMLVVGYK